LSARRRGGRLARKKRRRNDSLKRNTLKGVASPALKTTTAGGKGELLKKEVEKRWDQENSLRE